MRPACTAAVHAEPAAAHEPRAATPTFDLSAFAHEAFYNPVEGRIEIYFRSLARSDRSRLRDGASTFAEGERVHTEYSYKYDDAGIAALARSGGFTHRPRPGPIRRGCSPWSTWKRLPLKDASASGFLERAIRRRGEWHR